MREKAALYLLILSLFLIIGIDVTPYVLGPGRTGEFLSIIESVVDALVVVLTYVFLKRELSFRTKVLNMAAHDIRNPLGVIRGYAEIILEKSVPAEAEPELIRRIHSKSNEILQLVSDLLDSSVLEQRQVKLSPETSSLAAIIYQVIDEQGPAAVRKNQRLKLEMGAEPWVHADRARLKQVFQNLISNALKYSPPGSVVTVKLEGRGEAVRASVIDCGAGLKGAEKEQVFEAFSKVKKPTTGGENSTGIGLSICKALVNLNGGTIWAESEGHGRGSTFVVELPAARLETNRGP